MNKALQKQAVKIAEGQNSLIFYQQESDYGKPVIVKVLKDECNFYPHTSQIINEDEHVRGINIPGIRSSMDRMMVDNKPAIILEYLEGTTLKEQILKKKMSFIDRLKIAIDISSVLGKIHDLGIIHKDFNSYNILINERQEINVIDFGLSTRLSTKPDMKTASEYLEGTLPYISPEQTGRVNHVVDQRSDLYSLGIVLYELFAGELPFTSEDPMELVHSHLAVLPAPLEEVSPEMPKVVSDIVMKLLSKNMESRYQTSGGVLSDLQWCYSHLELKIAIEDFEIAKKDQSGKFLIPSKLYGRDKELDLLLDAFERLGDQNEITLIDGHSGTGKTSLIYEIHKPLTEKKGHFVHGKHEQFQKDIPYHAIVQSFKSFVNLLLSENEARLNYWRVLIKNALGTEGKLLTDLIPNLELIIGRQEPLGELGINEAQHRFDYTFLKFIRAIAASDHPLILFIDDLQWADTASLHLLKKINCDEELKNFYFIGAYRGNEVDDIHPMALIIKELKAQGAAINEIKLHDLKLEDVQCMVSDTLLLEQRQCRKLAEIVHEKTAGNPFFVNQFLISMHEKGLITFKHDARGGSWHCDVDGMRRMNFTDNVIEFMISKIENLNEQAVEILKLASCIGDSFDMETLTFISEKSQQEVGESVYEVIKEQFVVMQGGNPDLVHWQQKYGNTENSVVAHYKFTHDRIRQAAYAMVPDRLRSDLHLKIGQLMLKNIPAKKQEEQVFDIVFQLNNGIGDISSSKEKLSLARLNNKAADKAKSSSAYQKALNHYEIALSLVSARDKDEFFKSLLNGAMECAYLIGDYKKMEQLGREIVSHSKSVLEEVDAHRITILSYIARNRYQDATNFGREVLKKYGINFPENPGKLQIIVSFFKTRWVLRNKKASHFRDLSPISDEKVLARLKIIISFASAAYHNTPELFPLIVLRMMRMSVKYGNSTSLISTYGGYGILLCGITGEMDEGYAYGQESLKMLETFSNAKHASSRTLVIYTTFINHWKNHLSESFPLLMRAYYDAMETGDQEFAAGALFVHSYHSFVAGESLTTLTKRMVSHHRKICQLNQKSYEFYNTIGLQAMLNLSQNSSDPTILKGEFFDEDDFFDNRDGRRRHEDKTALFHYYFYKMYLNYLSGFYEKAATNSDMIRKLDVAMSTALIPTFIFYDSLVGLALYDKLSSSGKRKWVRRIRANQKKMKKWAKHAPMNFDHKYFLVEAGLCQVLHGNQIRIKTFFDQSIKGAGENGYTNDLAVAHEMAGKFHAAAGNHEKETVHIRKAYIAYQQWGVAIKPMSLMNEYNALLNVPKEDTLSRSQSFVSINTGNSLLDLSTVLKASSAITSEIKLKKLVHQLLKIVAENAGAQTGKFILIEDGTLKVRATLDELGNKSRIIQENVEGNDDVPLSVIQFVKRTGEDLVLDDACVDDRFSVDAYIREKRCRSLLCMPIVSKKKIIGIIYLENNLTTGAFTPQRLEILKMLSGQIAISLENAMLYDQLEQKVEERTREIDQQKEQLKHKNIELMNINQEKDDLINVVSHDLRSPLNQVKGLAQITAMETKDEQIKDYAEKMVEATDRLNNMITRILDVSAIEAQKIDITTEEVDVVECVNRVTEDFMADANNKQIDLKIESNVKRGIVALDKNYFIQIMENLVSNAIKFSYEKGIIRVIITHKNSDVKIEVKDTGPGISESDQKMLFSKFQKLSAKPTAGEKSTGLGLAIVKRYVDAMGGEIWCDSELYQGTSFFLEFKTAS